MSASDRDRTSSHRQQLANEQSADERYQGIVRAKQQLPRPYQGARNTMWTGSGIPHDISLPDGGLIGRIALDGQARGVGGDSFYIGPRYVQEDGLIVFSWAAPVASTLFQSATAHPLDRRVVVARSLIRDRRSIINFVDEARVDDAPEEPFVSSPLQIPSAPAPRPLPPRTGAVPPPSDAPGPTPGRSDASPAADARGTRHPAAAAPPVTPRRPTDGLQPTPQVDGRKANAARAGASRRSDEAGSHLRAGAALLAAVAAPREERLRSVLSTLQPDQYDLVTRTPEIPLVVQGHPGTGKTIVAAHRAAYLTHPDAPDGFRESRLLFVGPTEQYVNHVAGVLAELVQNRRHVEVLSVEQLLWRMRGGASRPLSSVPVRFADVDPKLGSLVGDAQFRLARLGGLKSAWSRERKIEALFESLRTEFPKSVRETEWAEYLARLPSYKKAAGMGRHHALIAQCAWAISPDPSLRADHVIVDEAQDVAPLEWRLLDRLNRGQHWTLLGDMNQRRSDWTQHGWHQLDDLLGLADEDGHLHVVTMDRGYRTTAAIMAFAGSLLPASERAVHSLQQGGEKPSVHRFPAERLPTQAAALALELKNRHPRGRVAVITVAPTPYEQALRKAGWSPQQRDVQVLDPDAARGLEFDAVVVVEPAAFPQNLGRNGPLYTSLTRANRELAVVHSQPLPDALRKHNRR